jgi:starch phosphorylase
MNNPERPVQFIFAGKAHPRDDEGKRLIRELVHTMRLEEFRRRMVFLEDYDIEVARYLVQGVDVWLNNPRRPMEASGTSGMKVLPNGGLNLSIPDGWWAEIDTPDAGWTIGSGEDYGDNYSYQDEVESHALYDILEREVAPLFYLRGRDGLPRKWIEKMRLSMKNLSAVFNTNRMVRDYLEKFYLPAMDKYQALSEDKFARARALASWKTKVTLSWNKIKVVKFNLSAAGEIKVGDQVTINAEVDLASLNPRDVSVQLYFGPLNDARQIENGKTFDLQAVSSKKNIHQFQGSVICQSSGRKGYGLRILPKHPDITYPQEMGLVYWYE